jgi:hypothetical protein
MAMRRTAQWREAQHFAGIVARSVLQVIVALGIMQGLSYELCKRDLVADSMSELYDGMRSLKKMENCPSTLFQSLIVRSHRFSRLVSAR